jgi:hypothetical protein
MVCLAEQLLRHPLHLQTRDNSVTLHALESVRVMQGTALILQIAIVHSTPSSSEQTGEYWTVDEPSTSDRRFLSRRSKA